MTNLAIGMFACIVGMVSAFWLGYQLRNIRDEIQLLKDRSKAAPTPGATLGTYGRIEDYNHINSDGSVGIVETKTPQRVAYEAEESLRREVNG